MAQISPAVAPGVDLYWLPLGAGEGTGIVRVSGRMYEAITARRDRRPRRDLYHAALEVHADGDRFTIEMAPAWGMSLPEHGAVSSGPVGLRTLGRWRLFTYEVRCWRQGTIPDLAFAVDSPRRVSRSEAQARQLLSSVAGVPQVTWGRDELGTGEMWNSNSLVAWLLARSGHDMEAIEPPANGRAPGWSAGLAVAGASTPDDAPA